MEVLEGVPESVLQCPTFLKSVLCLITPFSAYFYCVQFNVEHVFGRSWARMSVRTPVIITGIPQSLQANVGIVPILGQDCFLPNPFQFISYQSS
jgi:hypothetical protein